MILAFIGDQLKLTLEAEQQLDPTGLGRHYTSVKPVAHHLQLVRVVSGVNRGHFRD